MTKSITDIAREAGASAYTNRHYPDQPYMTFSPEKLERFATAIKAAHIAELAGVEIPEPAVVIRVWGNNHHIYPALKDDAFLYTLDQLQTAVAAAVLKAVAAEREACAKICDEAVKYYWPKFPESSGAALHLGTVIRARGNV